MASTIRVWAIVALVGVTCVSVAHAQIENPSFETGDLTGWGGGGQFGVQDEVSYWGLHAAYVGTVDFDGDEFNDFTGEPGGGAVDDNALGQILVPVPLGTTTLELAYNVFTWDCRDWDDPAFRVVASQGGIVLSVSSGDIDQDCIPLAVDSTGWETLSIPTGGASVFNIRFEAGNGFTGGALQSWAYVDAIRFEAPEPDASLATGLSVIYLSGLARGRRSSSAAG